MSEENETIGDYTTRRLAELTSTGKWENSTLFNDQNSVWYRKKDQKFCLHLVRT